MKHLFSAVALALLATAPLAASAASITVNFEKVWDYDNGGVANYYSGGTAADGTSGGPNLGVSFVNISGLSNTKDFTYYANAPSPIGVAYAYDTGAYVNLARGLNNFAFYYASFESVLGAVKAYSGLNGTGTLLGTFDIVTPNDVNASGLYDTFTLGNLAFSGLARSFDLSALAGRNVAFDAITVPEPSVVLLMITGGALALYRRKTPKH